MLGNNYLCEADEGVSALVLGDFVIFGTVDEADHIGILLDGTGFAEVGELRTLALGALTGFDATVQLREGDNRDVKLLCQALQRAGDGADLLFAAAEIHAAGVHELEVVDDDAFDAVLAD